MRLLVVLILAGLFMSAPSVQADGATTDSTSTTTATEPATSTESGPDPTGCRPYCMSG